MNVPCYRFDQFLEHQFRLADGDRIDLGEKEVLRHQRGVVAADNGEYLRRKGFDLLQRALGGIHLGGQGGDRDHFRPESPQYRIKSLVQAHIENANIVVRNHRSRHFQVQRLRQSHRTESHSCRHIGL